MGVCAWARVSAAPRHPGLGCWRPCVFVCGLLLYPSTPGWGVRCGCVCLDSGLGFASPLLAGVFGSLYVCVRAPPVPRPCWLRHPVWVRALVLGFGLRPATPGWGVGIGVCLCARSSCTPPILAGVSGVGVCAWARVLAAPRYSWRGCWGPCVFMCVLLLYPANPGWDVQCRCVCLGSGFGCAPPLLAGVLGSVCVCVRASPVPRQSWLGCALWGCVLGLGFQLRLATLGWGVTERVCVCVRAPPVPRHSWLGCAVWVCVLGPGFRLRPATSGWGVGVCVCFCACSSSTPPLLDGVCAVGVCARARVLAAPRHSWLGCDWSVCVCVRAPPVPCHSWLGSAVWVCVLGLGFRLRPATPGWGVGLFVCLCAHSSCTPPLLAGVCGVGVCAWARVSAAPRHSWLGCWGLFVFVCALLLYAATPGWGVRCVFVCLGSGFGCAPPILARVLQCVCVCVRALLVPRQSRLRCAVWVCVLGLRFRLRPATPGLAVGSCVSVCTLSLYPANPGWVLWSVGWVPDAVVPFSTPGAGAPGFTGLLRGARGGRPETALFVPAACPSRGRSAGLTPRRIRPRLRDRVVPGRFLQPRSWAACVAVVWRVWTRSLTCPVSPTARLSTGDSAGASRLFCVDVDSATFGSDDATPRSFACVRVRAPLGRVGGTGLLGVFWCASPLSVVGFAVLFFCLAPFGLALPCLWLLLRFFLIFCAPVVSCVPCLPAQGALGLAVLLSYRLPPPFCFSFFLSFLPPPFSCPPFFACLAPVVFCFGFFSLPFFFAVVCRLCGARVDGVSCAVVYAGVCCCGCCAAGAGLRLRRVVQCSLVVPGLCVLLRVVMRVSGGAMLAAFLFCVLPLLPCLCALSSGLVLRRLRPVVALWCCGGVRLLRQVLSCCFASGWCVFWWSLWCGVLPRCGVLCGADRPPPPASPVCCALPSFRECAACAPCPPRLVLVPCGVHCCASCCVVLRSVVCFVFCPVLCGVLVLGLVLAPCCAARCCDRSCCGAFVVFCCCLLLRSLLVFFWRCSLPFLWCSGLFLSVWCSVLLPVWSCCGAFLCWFLLRCAVWCSVVPWCVSWFCAVLFVSLQCFGRVLPPSL